MIHKILLAFFVIVLLLASASCKKELKQRVASKDELYAYLDSLEKRYESACGKVQLAEWNQIAGNKAIDINSAQGELRNIFLDTTASNIIEEWRSRSSSLADKILARRLELWHRCFIGAKFFSGSEIESLKNSLEQKYLNFKIPYEGKTLTLQEAKFELQKEKKQARRQKLWTVTTQMTTSLTADYVKLVELCNTKAKALGFPNYYSLLLHIEAVDEMWLIKTINNLDNLSSPEFEKLIRSTKKKLRLKEFDPWDLDFVLQDIPSLPDKYFPADSIIDVIYNFEKAIGFGKDSLSIKASHGLSGKSAECSIINSPKDICIQFAALKGAEFYKCNLFEYGRALRAVNIKSEFPVLKGYEFIPGATNPSYQHGIAQVHRDFVDDSLWLTTFTKAKDKEIKQYLSKRNIPATYQLRIMLKDFFIEYEIFKNPKQNLDSLNTILFNKILLDSTHAQSTIPFNVKLDFIQNPCGLHTVLLSEMISAQLHEAIASKFGNEKISSSAVAKWMIENLYSSGELIEWYEHIRNATGKNVEPGPYLRKLSVESTSFITKEPK